MAKYATTILAAVLLYVAARWSVSTDLHTRQSLMLEYTAFGLFGLGIAIALIGLWNPAERDSSEQGSMFSFAACVMLVGIGLKPFFT